jgi:flagellar hook protein FlgE
MDVIGNNIANVNTTGFKRSRVTFSTMLSQTMKGASSPSDNQGGTNSSQVGLGSMLASIDQIMTQGSSQSTGKDTDVMIQGSGFFVLQNSGQTVYTRSGAFSQDSNGTLIDPATGANVLGYMWGVDDSTPADFTNLTPLRFALGDALPQKAQIALPSQPANGVYPSNGWISATMYSDPSLIGVCVDGDIDGTGDGDLVGGLGLTGTNSATLDPSTGTITFNSAAAATEAITNTSDPTTPLVLNRQGTVTISALPTTFPGNGWVNETTYVNAAWKGASLEAIPANATFDSATGTLSFNTAADAAAVDGDTLEMTWTPPSLTSFSIDPTGIITGVYSNGVASATHRIGQIAIAKFANDSGLSNLGGNFFAVSNNSGAASIGAAGKEGRGTLVPNAVEMSNVDLSQEFTDMIVTQRGFQANSRVITVSDSLLQELIDLKRG